MERNMYNYNAYCTNVVDGDTVDLEIDAGFKLFTEQRIRLLGVNTPERGQIGYKDATDFLKHLILNKDVVVETHNSDAFGRYLAEIYVDGVHVNEQLLLLGYAVPYLK